MTHKQNGNVLFLILIAVALFAALSYAITNSNRSSGNVSTEKFKTVKSEIDNAIVSYRTAIQRIIISEKYDSSEISAEFSSIPILSYVNTNCTSNACKMFHPQGGGASPYILKEPGVLNSSDTSYPLFVLLTWWNQQGLGKPDIIAGLRVSKEFCDYYNKALGITTPALAAFPNSSNTGAYPIMAGQFSGLPDAALSDGLGTASSGGTPLANQETGCYYNTNASTYSGVGYYVVAVIYPR